MAKKYLSLEEAAAQLGVNTADVNRLRESGDLRGFADRGTWKFRAEDVEEAFRNRQADSNPDVPLLDRNVVSDGEDELGDQATIIRGGSDVLDEGLLSGPGDSDVRLILDDDLASDYQIAAAKSDSDVRLAPSSTHLLETDGVFDAGNSDSDVKLVGSQSDSDVRLATDSDSDVRLAADSDSDVKLADSDSDVKLAGESRGSDSDVKLLAKTEGEFDLIDDRIDLDTSEPSEGDSVLLDDDSGIALEHVGDSGISLERDSGPKRPAASDSGILLDDSADGIEAGGSGIMLAGDSGIEFADDSGIELDDDSGLTLAGDSGIALDAPSDDGLSLEGSGPGLDDGTVPILEAPFEGDEEDATRVEVPTLDDEDSEFELSLDHSPSASSTDSEASVIMFDDMDEVDDRAATVVKRSAEVEDEFGEFDDEVDDDILGEDDELDDLDVFDAEDDDFDESFQTGESHAEFVAPVQQVVVAPQQEWGAMTFVGLLLATCIMAVCGIVMFDFVRSMWSWSQPTSVSSTILEQVGGFFKK